MIISQPDRDDETHPVSQHRCDASRLLYSVRGECNRQNFGLSGAFGYLSCRGTVRGIKPLFTLYRHDSFVVEHLPILNERDEIQGLYHASMDALANSLEAEITFNSWQQETMSEPLKKISFEDTRN